MEVRFVQTRWGRQLRGETDGRRSRIGDDAIQRTGAFPADKPRHPRRSPLQSLAQLRTKPFELGTQLAGLLLPLGAQTLQQPDMAFLLARRPDGCGEFREDIHVPNFPGTLAEATQFLHDRLRDAFVSEGQSLEGCFKAASAGAQIVNLFGRGIAVQLS